MKLWLLHILKCPRCDHTPLHPKVASKYQGNFPEPPFFNKPCIRHGRPCCLECQQTAIKSGSLVCDCKAEYPVIDFIPYFAVEPANQLSADTADCFGYLWDEFDYDELYGRSPEEDLRTFSLKTGIDETSLRGKIVLDMGCGSGSLTKQLSDYGSYTIGCDIAVADSMRSQEREKSFDFIQCDILNSPFVKGCFDFVYSIGVLHHIREIGTALRNMVAATKPDGELAFWIYDGSRARFKTMDSLIRTIVGHLPVSAVKTIAYSISPVYPIIRRLQGAKPRRIEMKDRAHIIFDWLKTPYRKFHRVEDLELLLRNLGMEVCYQSPHSIGLRSKFSNCGNQF